MTIEPLLNSNNAADIPDAWLTLWEVHPHEPIDFEDSIRPPPATIRNSS